MVAVGYKLTLNAALKATSLVVEWKPESAGNTTERRRNCPEWVILSSKMPPPPRDDERA